MNMTYVFIFCTNWVHVLYPTFKDITHLSPITLVSLAYISKRLSLNCRRSFLLLVNRKTFGWEYGLVKLILLLLPLPPPEIYHRKLESNNIELYKSRKPIQTHVSIQASSIEECQKFLHVLSKCHFYFFEGIYKPEQFFWARYSNNKLVKTRNLIIISELSLWSADGNFYSGGHNNQMARITQKLHVSWLLLDNNR